MNCPVSILMPCYNAERFLRPAVESMLQQSFRDFEFLIIDDGSTDRTYEILSEYAARDPRIRLLKNDQNRKLIYTLNRGAALARGKYIVRMDADDISMPNRIETQYQFMEAHPEVDASSAGYFKLNEQGRIIDEVHPKAIRAKVLKFVSFFSTPLNHPTLIIKTALLQEALYDSEYIHSEDYELFSRLLLQDYHLTNIDQPLNNVRENLSSVSFKFERIQIETHTKISRRNLKNYFDYEPDFFLHKVMIYRVGFKPSKTLVYMALKELESLLSKYIEKEKCTDDDIIELEHFITEHKMDMIFQSFKAAGIMGKLQLLPLMLKNRHLISSNRGSSYFKSKLKKKMKG